MMRMKFISARKLVATSAITGLLGLGAIAGSAYVHGDPAPSNVPVVYKTSTAPNVSPEEARRAVSSAKDLSTAFRVAADKVLPSLVTIETKSKPVQAPVRRKGHSAPDGMGGRNPFAGTPFEDMFKGFEMQGDGAEQFGFGAPDSHPQEGLGSGVIIDGSGLIMTNNHVVAGGKSVDVLVRLWDGREYKADKVWTDPKTDIAIVKIEGADDLTVAALGDSDQVAVGDWVLALGQPFGLESTVTAGIVSATHRGVGINARESFLQTDAAINPGNSGGPLVNLDGQVVGINTAISSRGGGNDGVGFAVPVNLAKWVGDQLVKNGEVHRAYLGVGIQPVNATLAKQFNVKPREGVVVTEVYPNTPAAKAGLKSGDVIRSFAGVGVNSPRELQLLVERAEVGRPHGIELVRNGKSMTLNFVPEMQSEDLEAKLGDADSSGHMPAESSSFEALGLELSNLDAAVAEQLGIKGEEGVVITSVTPGSVADRAGLESGMVIAQINRKPVKDMSAAEKALSGYKSGDDLLLLIKTEAGSRFIVIGS
ncbi:MAG: Do family serine endopeptidase [Aureliella sp.]